MYYRRIACLLTLVCLAAALIPRHAIAQDTNWRQPLELSDIQYSKWSWFPDITVKPDGSIAAVWCSFPRTVDYAGDPISIDALMYRELKNGQWSKTTDLYSASHSISARKSLEYTVRNSIFAGRDGKLHVIFRKMTDVAYMSAPWDRAYTVHGWSPSILLGDNGAYYNAIAVDNKGYIHAFYTEGVRDTPNHRRLGCPNCANLFYRVSRDGGETWSLPVNLSYDLEGANRPQVVVDRFDRIHVVWDEGFDWYVGLGEPKYGAYRRSDDGGRTWTETVKLTVPSGGTYQTALAVDQNGNPMVAYRTGQWLYSQRSLDGGNTWSTPIEIPGVEARNPTDPNLDRYSMEFDSAGRAHLIAVAFRTNGKGVVPALLHLVYDGQRWLEAEVIYEGPLYPEWPRIVVADGNQLHAIWFTRVVLYGDEIDIKQIWYSTKTVDAPLTTPPPLFTPTPRPTLTSTPLPLPTPTPLSREEILEVALDARVTWERSSMGIVGTALLPVLGLLTAVVIITHRVRR